MTATFDHPNAVGAKPVPPSNNPDAELLWSRAMDDSGSSDPAARVLWACHTGDSVVSIWDVRMLDDRHSAAALRLIVQAYRIGCDGVLPQPMMNRLYDKRPPERLRS